MTLEAALAPRSIAVVGASDNPHKVGGRPILYMKRFGYRGAIYPVNPGRGVVQELKAYPSLQDLPEAPDLAVVAVAGEEAVRAVEGCAGRGVKVAVVMTSGFGETGEPGRGLQEHMVAVARAAGMRLVGPNCQGLANFATGAMANFSTIFHELGGRDGPVAIVSQSGANSQAIYTLVHEKGLGVRHVHATGNEADVTISDLTAAVVDDPGVALVLLYMEAIKDPAGLARAAERARERDLPIVALKAGRTPRGQKAASSHTGALASEDRVVDAFFERHGIWRAADPQALVSAAELYVAGRRPRGKRLVFMSNSGASCVMGADAAEAGGVPLAEVSEEAKRELRKTLPAFASLENPIDITGALLGNPGLFAAVLPAIGEDARSDLALVALPVAGEGYDVPAFARDFAAFGERFGHACAMAAPQAPVRAAFRDRGIATFASEREAMAALAQVADHTSLLRRKASSPESAKAIEPFPRGTDRFLNEAESLQALSEAGVQVVEHRLCRSAEEARAAAQALGGVVALKACSRELPHKSDHGLVVLGCRDAAADFARLEAKVGQLGARFEGAIVARMAPKGRELALGARVDPQFGPVVMVGDGGVYLEALKDFRLLLPPFDEAEVLAKLGELRIAPLLGALRGQPARDLSAVARMAVRLGEAILAWRASVASIDVNPVIVFETGQGALAVDALIERAL